MEIKASCIYDKSALTALADVQMFSKSDPKKRRAQIITLMVVPIVLFVIMSAFTGFDADDIKPLVLVLITYGGLAFLVFITPKMAYKNSGHVAESINEYVFKDTLFEVESANEGVSSQTKFSYDNIHKVFETSDYLFIYINKMSAFIVEKCTISGDGMAQLRNILQPMLGKRKYIICKY